MAKICDYEGSSYHTDFWEGQGREYEDLAERVALAGFCLLLALAWWRRVNRFT